LNIRFLDNCADEVALKTSDLRKPTKSWSATSSTCDEADILEPKDSVNKKTSQKLNDELEMDDEMEVWILQCPKNFNPTHILNRELENLGKKAGGVKLECSADRFTKKQTLAVISTEKAAEYKIFCNNIKLVSC
jgi:hypothetical protein